MDRSGFILYVFNYSECVTFYREVVELRELFSTESLTCFEFGKSYLMIEPDDESDPTIDYTERTRTCLRMNVTDVKEQAIRLTRLGVDVDYAEHNWGIVAKFTDPDGNLLAFKDSSSFELQIRQGAV